MTRQFSVLRRRWVKLETRIWRYHATENGTESYRWAFQTHSPVPYLMPTDPWTLARGFKETAVDTFSLVSWPSAKAVGSVYRSPCNGWSPINQSIHVYKCGRLPRSLSGVAVLHVIVLKVRPERGKRAPRHRLARRPLHHAAESRRCLHKAV